MLFVKLDYTPVHWISVANILTCINTLCLIDWRHAVVTYQQCCCWSLKHSSCCLHIEMHFSEGWWTAAIRSRLSSSSLIMIKAHVCTENWEMCERYARHELVRQNVRWNLKSKYHVEWYLLVFSYKLTFSEMNGVFNGIIEGWGFLSRKKKKRHNMADWFQTHPHSFTCSTV